MRLALISALVVIAASTASAFDYDTGGCATAGCGTGEQWLPSNANEVDAALDIVESGLLDKIESVSDDTAPVLGGNLDANGNDILDVDLIEAKRIGDVYHCDQYAGADLWEKCQAAFDEAVNANARAVILELPRGSYTVTSGTLDLCDDRSGLLNYGVILRGQGSATLSGGTRVTFGSGFESAAIADTYTFGAGAGDGGRDTITCAACDFLASSNYFKRGDLIETTGFSTSTNNYPRTGGTEAEGEHLRVYRATSTVLTVEAENSIDTALSGTSVTGNVRRLNAGIETCGYGSYVENVTLTTDTTANYADIMIHHRPDIYPYLACSGANAPYATYCTGAGTGASMSSIGGVNGGASQVYVSGGRFGLAVTSLESSGQADHYRINDSNFHSNRVAIYYDSLQAQPGVKISDTQLSTFRKNGFRIMSGSGILENVTTISTSADCIADTFGPCNHIYMGYENVETLVFDGRSFMEIKGGNGVKVADGGSTETTRRFLSLGTSRIIANTSAETDVALIDAPDACLSVDMRGTRFTSGTDPTNPPTVTFGNSEQANCPGVIDGHWAVADPGGDGSHTPVVTINNGIPVTAFSDDILSAIGADLSSPTFIMFRDSDDAGFTECGALNGSISCAIDADGVPDGSL